MIGDRKLYPGDYNRAESGSVDHRVWSETGCTTSFSDCLGRVPVSLEHDLFTEHAETAAAGEDAEAA